MRTVIQRVSRAEVRVDGETVGAIGKGALLLVGIEQGDTDADVAATVRKVAALRMFRGRTPMDLTLGEVGGAVLVVSQFTLAAEMRKGNRPGFTRAEDPERAEQLYLRTAAALQSAGIPVARGRFGATMEVDLVNDGPVTLLLFVRNGKVIE